jgi:urease subunit beta
MRPGEYLLNENAGDLLANAGRETARVSVRHTGDRPIQVGSHFHFFEVNRALVFDRTAAYGMRLNIAAGTAVRFEPGEEKEVSLVAYAGHRVVFGHNGLVEGPLDDAATRERALKADARRQTPDASKGVG